MPLSSSVGNQPLPGTLEVRDLRVVCIIGALPQERSEPQEISIDLRVWLDFAPAARSDSLSQTVNYCELAQHCTRIAQEGKFQLLETLCATIATQLLQHYPPLGRIEIRITKAAIPESKAVVAALVLDRKSLS